MDVQELVKMPRVGDRPEGSVCFFFYFTSEFFDSCTSFHDSYFWEVVALVLDGLEETDGGGDIMLELLGFCFFAIYEVLEVVDLFGEDESSFA